MTLKIKLILFLIVLLCISQSLSQTNFWQQTSGPTLGDIFSLASDSSSHRIYAGFEGGVAVSSDSGKNWTRLRGRLDNSRVTRLALKNNGIIFAGTSDQGIFKSTNGGEDWEQASDSLNTEGITGISITPSGIIYTSCGSGLYQSSNDGITWNHIFSGYIEAIAIDTTGRIIVATNFSSDRMGVVGGIFRSSDSGTSWERINNGLPSSYFYPQALFISKNQIVYLGLQGGFFRSTNNGSTWLKTSLGSISIIDEMNNGYLVAGDDFMGSMFRSTDNGMTWVANGNGIRNFRIHSSTKSIGGLFLVATNGGIYSTKDCGDYWKKIHSGYTYITTTDIALHPNSSVWAVASFYNVGSGVFVSTNNGMDWIEKSFGSPDLRYNSITIDAMGVVYLGTSDGIFSTSDLVENWIQRNVGLDSLYTYDIFAAKNNYIYVSTGGVYSTNMQSLHRSTDQGLHWNKIGVGLPPTSITSRFITDSSDNLYACVEQHGLYRSSDHGESWAPINNGFPDTTSVGPIVVSTINYLYACNSQYGIFQSTNGGSSWNLRGNSGLTAPSFTSLVIDYRNNLYVGAGNLAGVFISTDSGKSWSSSSAGMDSLAAWDLCFDSHGFLLAGTYGSGVYRSQYPVDDVRERERYTPAAFSLRQNYPNPFNPSTRIRYELTVQSQVHLTVYNILGQVVANLAQGVQEAGSKSVEWNAAGLPSGVYFYRLDATSVSDPSKRFTQTRKMVLIK